MNSPQYDDNLLRQYLLGGLSEVQVEEFDELSIIDDEFAAQLGAVENDLIDAYVQGTLSGPTRAQFEARYLTSPRRREKVKFAQSLQTFAETRLQTRTAEAVAPLPTNSEPDTPAPEPLLPAVPDAVPWWRSFVNLLTIPNLTFQWGLATAALLMLVLGGWLMVRTARLQNQIAQADAERAAIQQREKDLQTQLAQARETNAQTAEHLQSELKRTQEKLAQLEHERQLVQQRKPTSPTEPKIALFTLEAQTLSDSSTISIPPDLDYVTFTLELETDDFSAYRAELRTQTGNQIVWSSGKLRTRSKGRNKVVDVSIPAAKLTVRGYELFLKGIAANNKLQPGPSYAFRVVKP